LFAYRCGFQHSGIWLAGTIYTRLGPGNCRIDSIDRATMAFRAKALTNVGVVGWQGGIISAPDATTSGTQIDAAILAGTQYCEIARREVMRPGSCGRRVASPCSWGLGAAGQSNSTLTTQHWINTAAHVSMGLGSPNTPARRRPALNDTICICFYVRRPDGAFTATFQNASRSNANWLWW